MTRRPVTRLKVASAVLAGTAAAAAAAGWWVIASAPAFAAPDPVTVPLANAALLVNATSGATSQQIRAAGAAAEVINAAMPFSRGPLNPAQPFMVSGSARDVQRAEFCLTQAVYYEAGFEPLEGRRAVAQVVLNRMKHPAFPKSVCGVVYQGAGSGVCQFTFVCDGALAKPPEAGAWRQARAIAHAALAGYVEQSVGRATHYHADYVSPRWAPLLAKVSKIGSHIFYRWPGAWGQPRAFTGRYIGEPADPSSLRPRRATMATADAGDAVATEPGPDVRRAPNDVGGLLDTSKGWTLHIPDPRESEGAASRVAARQQDSISSAPLVVASAAPAASTAR